MRIPSSAAPDVQESLRELWAAVDRLGNAGSLNTDLNGRRLINGGDAILPTDYVTKRQLDAAGAADLPKNAKFDNLVVRALARFLGTAYLPRFTDGTAHYAILFVDATGAVAINEDGEYALDLNLSTGQLELGYNLRVKWFGRSALGSPSDGVITALDAALSSFSRLVLGPDSGGGIALQKNGTTLEIRVGGGGALTNLACADLAAATINGAAVMTPSGVLAAISGASITPAVAVVGTDPGGGAPLRVGGEARINGKITMSGDISGALDVSGTGYTVNGHGGASGTGTVISSITVENGIVTAISVA